MLLLPKSENTNFKLVLPTFHNSAKTHKRKNPSKSENGLHSTNCPNIQNGHYIYGFFLRNCSKTFYYYLIHESLTHTKRSLFHCLRN